MPSRKALPPSKPTRVPARSAPATTTPSSEPSPSSSRAGFRVIRDSARELPSQLGPARHHAHRARHRKARGNDAALKGGIMSSHHASRPDHPDLHEFFAKDPLGSGPRLLRTGGVLRPARLPARGRARHHGRHGGGRHPLPSQHARRAHPGRLRGREPARRQGRADPAERPSAQCRDAAPPAGRCDHPDLAPLHPQQRPAAGRRGPGGLDPHRGRPRRPSLHVLDRRSAIEIRSRHDGPPHRVRGETGAPSSFHRSGATSGPTARSPARSGRECASGTCSRRPACSPASSTPRTSAPTRTSRGRRASFPSPAACRSPRQ